MKIAIKAIFIQLNSMVCSETFTNTTKEVLFRTQHRYFQTTSNKNKIQTKHKVNNKVTFSAHDNNQESA